MTVLIFVEELVPRFVICFFHFLSFGLTGPRAPFLARRPARHCAPWPQEPTTALNSEAAQVDCSSGCHFLKQWMEVTLRCSTAHQSEKVPPSTRTSHDLVPTHSNPLAYLWYSIGASLGHFKVTVPIMPVSVVLPPWVR